MLATITVFALPPKESEWENHSNKIFNVWVILLNTRMKKIGYFFIYYFLNMTEYITTSVVSVFSGKKALNNRRNTEICCYHFWQVIS